MRIAIESLHRQRLRPVAVSTDVSPGNASCRLPPTGQFGKLARCVELAKAHEARGGVKYDLMMRTYIRPLKPVFA